MHNWLMFFEAGILWQVWWCSDCGCCRWEQELPNETREVRYYALSSPQQLDQEPKCEVPRLQEALIEYVATLEVRQQLPVEVFKSEDRLGANVISELRTILDGGTIP